MVTVGELFRLSRVLREVALEAATDPGETSPSVGLLAVTDDIVHHEGTTVGEAPPAPGWRRA